MTGVAMIGFGFILFIADLFMTAHGILTAGGIVALVMGGLLLIVELLLEMALVITAEEALPAGDSTVA